MPKPTREQVMAELQRLPPEQHQAFLAEVERRLKEPDAPQGLHAAAAGAETIGERPWYQQGVPISRLVGFGMKGPDWVEDRVPKVSVQDAMDALPAVGGALGGIIGGAAGVPTGGTASPVAAIGGAGLGGAAGESARQLGMRAIGGYAPQSSGEAAKGIATEAATQALAEGSGVLAGKGMKAFGERLMQSAVKPNPSLLKKYKTTAPRLVKDLLDNGVNMSEGGLRRLDDLLSAKNTEISEAVKNAAGSISRDDVVARASGVKATLAQQVNPKQPLKAAERSLEEFRTGGVDPTPAGPAPTAGPLTPAEAQAMKVGTYKQIEKSYMRRGTATEQAQQALARGLKEELERVVPGIKNMNAEEARLMAAKGAIAHRVGLSGNRDPVGFAWTASHAPQTFLAALIDRWPVVKSMIAQGMYHSAGKATKVNPQVIRAAVYALASSEGDAAPAQE